MKGQIEMNRGMLNAVELLDGEIKKSLQKISPEASDRINEIRLRSGRHLTLTLNGKDYFLSPGSELIQKPQDAIICADSDIEYAFKTAFSYSLHSYSKELASGYITTKGGNRVGICGTAVSTNGTEQVDTVKYISSLNIRIARQIKGFAEGVYEKCLADRLCGVLIIGPPASGKTTFLRDLTRLLGSKTKVSLIDELNEISATYRNKPQNDIGTMTDVFVGYPKHKGIETAVRVMSPRAIVVDEIGTERDLYSLEYALHSGVFLITAVHGTDLEDARRKSCIMSLMKERAFDYAVELHSGYGIKVKKID